MLNIDKAAVFANFAISMDVSNQLTEFGAVYDREHKQWVFNMDKYGVVLKYLENKFNSLS